VNDYDETSKMRLSLKLQPGDMLYDKLQKTFGKKSKFINRPIKINKIPIIEEERPVSQLAIPSTVVMSPPPKKLDINALSIKHGRKLSDVVSFNTILENFNLSPANHNKSSPPPPLSLKNQN
jgi:hypothetical protein